MKNSDIELEGGYSMEKVCCICGKTFWSTTTAKVCSPECRYKMQRQTRKNWEERTDYKHRLQADRADYAEATKAAIDKRNAADQHRLDLNRKHREQYRRRKQREALEDAAASGDAFARMKLAVPQSEDYWNAYRDYALDYADQTGTECRLTVNGISAYDEDFGLKVEMTIKELGSATVCNR